MAFISFSPNYTYINILQFQAIYSITNNKTRKPYTQNVAPPN